MKTIKEHEKPGAYCPWIGKYGQCVKCMAMISINDNAFICGRLYPPEHFKQEIQLGIVEGQRTESTDY